MTANLTPGSSTPNLHRACTNVGVATIPKYRAVKQSGTAAKGGDIATTPATDVIMGVTVEAIDPDKTKSIQRDGLVTLEAGAAVVRGNRIMTDGSGRGVPVTSTNLVFAIAESGASGPGVLFQAELIHP